jgi:hypothetical protein
MGRKATIPLRRSVGNNDPRIFVTTVSVNTEGRMEPWETPAAISLGVENLPSTQTLNFLLL